MKYAIYFTWNDGTEDSFDAINKKDRNLNIKQMIARKEFSSISYAKKYANGEIGKRIDCMKVVDKVLEG